MSRVASELTTAGTFSQLMPSSRALRCSVVVELQSASLSDIFFPASHFPEEGEGMTDSAYASSDDGGVAPDTDTARSELGSFVPTCRRVVVLPRPDLTVSVDWSESGREPAWDGCVGDVDETVQDLVVDTEEDWTEVKRGAR